MIKALRYEWRRIRTIRSTWMLSLLAVVSSGVIAYVMAEIQIPTSFSRGGYLQVLSAPRYLSPILVALIGIFAFGHEYRHGTIRASLTALPRRTALYTAKILVVAFWALLIGGITLAVSWGAAFLEFGDQVLEVSLITAPVPRILIGVLAMIGIYTLLGLAYAGLFRSQTGPIVVLLVIPLLIEPLLGPLLQAGFVQWLEPVADYLPYTAGNRMLVGTPFIPDQGLSPLTGGLVFGAFAFILLLLTWLLFTKRDA